ncbi:dehydroascorbate reductase 2 [Artemisia annua]|uniref:glutathione transferase n=1 Tax=Artemisia annua TaxID=35608 RepID=A0A2U1N1I2_ARTAN|nr:dehydroascorbate reductase 2 [Artemisia annua]
MSFHKLSFSEYEILGALDEDNMIGNGSSEEVYIVVLSNGDVVAVKKLWSSSKKGDDEDLENGSQIFNPRVGGSASAPSASLSLQHNRAKQTIEICVKAATGAPDVLGECPFCQWVLLTLEEKKVSYKTRLINMKNKPEWFVEVNPDGILPLIKFGDENWVSNSDVIVEMIDEKYPKPALLAPNQFASLGLKILPKGPYVNGRKITAVDLSLAPKLYHLGVALGHFKKWALPQTLTHVHKYTKLLFKCKSFKKTKPFEDHVIAGWEANP